MSVKFVLLLCAQALLIQGISTQCIGAYDGYAYGAPSAAPCGLAGAPWPGYGPAAFPASNGGGFNTASSSPLVPAGVSILSENAYEGTLAVGGTLPFLGTVAIEGLLPTAGAGAVAYGCGSGAVRITAEDVGAGFAGPLGYGGLAGPVADPAAYGPECGCGAYY